MFNKYMRLAILVVAISLVATFSFAAMVKVELPELTKEAEVIAIGQVVDLNSRWLGKPKTSTIITDVTVAVQDVLKGNVRAGERLTVKVYGGEIGDIGLRVSEEPQFSGGEEVIIFLNKDTDGLYRPTQLFQGKYTIEGNNIKENNLVVDEFIKEIERNIK